MYSMGYALCLQAELLVRFVLFYFRIHRPLLKRKISLGRDGVTDSEI